MWSLCLIYNIVINILYFCISDVIRLVSRFGSIIESWKNGNKSKCIEVKIEDLEYYYRFFPFSPFFPFYLPVYLFVRDVFVVPFLNACIYTFAGLLESCVHCEDNLLTSLINIFQITQGIQLLLLSSSARFENFLVYCRFICLNFS